LYTNKDSIEKGFVGSTIKHLSKSFINDMLIKIPSLEKQKEIYKYLSEMDEHHRRAYDIAYDHLGTSFNIARSNGFKEWLSKKQT